MKKNINLLRLLAAMLIAVFSVNQLTAQWENVLEKPSPNFFNDIWFVAGDDGLWQTGWVIEYHGEIYKTTDAGDSWTSIAVDFSEQLSTMCFIDENTGWLCTYDGLIMKSEDGGESWTEQHNDPSGWFSSVRFADENNGVVSGTPNLYTHDGGATWEQAAQQNGDYAYGYVDYAEGNTYYTSEIWGGFVGRTTDGGETWENIYQEPSLLNNYIDCLDGQHIMTGGSNERVLFTHDGGENWDLVTVDDGQGDAACFGWFDADTMYAAGTDIYLSTDGGYNWVVDTVIGAGSHKDIFVTPTNKVYVVNDIITGNNSIWRKNGVFPANAMFEASETTTCAGATVDFTDLSVYDITSWEWTFEGGSPSTSTEQNPSVTYDSPGVFDVTLTVTNSLGNTGTNTATDFISVYVIPNQANIPSGEAGICTGNTYYYSTDEVDFAQEYEWEVLPNEAGTFSWNDTELIFQASDDWTGDFTMKVRATNLCGDGDWSDELTITLSATPEVYTLEGGGSYCAGGEGVEITLNGSQTGVDYELYFEGDATGNIVSGTGDALSFGNLTEAGLYEALGYNDNCETSMSEQVEVIVNELPTPEVTGLDMVCDHDVTDYETVENAGSTYNWEVSGGTIVDGQGTYMVTIEWGDAGEGTVTVTEEDENGCEATTEAFDVFIDDCTDISENDLSSHFVIYPNPVTNQLNIDFNKMPGEKIKIVILNQLGQKMINSEIASKEGERSVQLNVSGLSKGFYIMKVSFGNTSVITKQFIKD